MKCQSCETENPDGANFCRGCGANLKEQAAERAQVQAHVEDGKPPAESATAAAPATPAEAQGAQASGQAAEKAQAQEQAQEQQPQQPQQPQAQGQTQAQAQQTQAQPQQAQTQAQTQFQAQPQQAQAQQQFQPQPQPSVNVKGEISKLQGKLDNSSSSLLRGRSLWDVVGICAVALMVVCFFLPSISGGSEQGSVTLSLSSLMSMAGSVSYTSSFSVLFLIYLFPAVCCFIDLVVTKNNSTRHVRLIVLGLLNMLLQSSISSISNLVPTLSLLSGFSADSAFLSLGIGFYLSMFASIVVIVVGAIEIYEAKKGKIAS